MLGKETHDRPSGSLELVGASPRKSESHYGGLVEEGHGDMTTTTTAPATASRWRIKHPLISELLAEIVGTFIIIFMGDSAVAAAVMADGTHGNPTTIGISWGLAVTMAIMATGANSPAHLNPAITICNAATGRFPWKKVVPYIIAQIFAGWLAAACVYICYYDYFPGFGYNFVSSTIFTTFPKPGVGHLTSFFTEFIGTLVLMLVVYSTADRWNTNNEKNSGAIIVGGAVALLVFAFQTVNGIALNPARDMGPRLFIAMAPWGSNAFSYNDYYWWIPTVATTLGAVAGGFLYILLIENNQIDKKE